MLNKMMNIKVILTGLIISAVVILSIWGNEINPMLTDVLKELIQAVTIN